jgi:hypothetical protein
MASNAYVTGRQKYARPQAVLWSETEPVLTNGLYLPSGSEPGSNNWIKGNDEFIILSDHNRQPIDVAIERIENRQRTINGRMRSHHIADKITLALSWDMLPSKSYALDPKFDTEGKTEYLGGSGVPGKTDMEYTVDGGAGGAELLHWYNNHQGSFWVMLSYDNYKDTVFNGTDMYSDLAIQRYTQVKEMFVSDFTYSIQKRGAGNLDLWNLSVSLEEA